jgi:putative flippase GtrA
MKWKLSLEAVFRGNQVGVPHRVVRHLIAGGLGTVIYIALVAGFVELVGLHPVTSAVLAFIVLEVFVYWTNRLWVYRATQDHRYAIPRFVVVSLVGIVLNAALMYGVVEGLDLAYGWGLVATTLVVPPTNFLLNFLWAFK